MMLYSPRYICYHMFWAVAMALTIKTEQNQTVLHLLYRDIDDFEASYCAGG